MFIDIKIELDVMIQDSRQSKHLNFKVKNNSTRALNQHQSKCLLYNSRWSKLILQVLSWCQTSVLILIPMMASTELKTKQNTTQSNTCFLPLGRTSGTVTVKNWEPSLQLLNLVNFKPSGLQFQLKTYVKKGMSTYWNDKNNWGWKFQLQLTCFIDVNMKQR
jgi:hypothetical protein